MADVNGAASLLTKFKSLVSSKQLDAARDVATELKLKFVEFPALPPLLQPTPTKDKELLLARDMLEHSIFLAIHLKDDTLFDRNFQQLHVYYTDLHEALPPSAQEASILGLNLLRLLTQNRVAEFHVELELQPTELLTSPHLEFPRQLEQQLMEGMYSKVLESLAAAPNPLMGWFVSQLRETVRDEVAACAAAAYQRLLHKDAASMLGFSTQQDLFAYCTSHGWSTDAQYVHFVTPDCRSSEKSSLDVFHNMITYARELDRIV